MLAKGGNKAMGESLERWHVATFSLWDDIDVHMMPGLRAVSASLPPGKDEYKFGDISKEAAKRAKNAEEYKFGDVTKKAVNKAMDAIAGFTGKEDRALRTGTRDSRPLRVQVRRHHEDIAEVPRPRVESAGILLLDVSENEAPSELCGVAEWSRSPVGKKRVNAAPWSEQTPVYRAEDHSEVQSTEVPSEPWRDRAFRVPEVEADRSRALTGKEVKRPDYVNLISLTSKMKKQAAQAAQRRTASAPRNVDAGVIPQHDRPIPCVRQGRRHSETERLRSAMRLLPRRRSRDQDVVVTQATRRPH
eukprot:s1163_g16.t1